VILFEVSTKYYKIVIKYRTHCESYVDMSPFGFPVQGHVVFASSFFVFLVFTKGPGQLPIQALAHGFGKLKLQ